MPREPVSTELVNEQHTIYHKKMKIAEFYPRLKSRLPLPAEFAGLRFHGPCAFVVKADPDSEPPRDKDTKDDTSPEFPGKYQPPRALISLRTIGFPGPGTLARHQPGGNRDEQQQK